MAASAKWTFTYLNARILSPFHPAGNVSGRLPSLVFQCRPTDSVTNSFYLIIIMTPTFERE
jgi:hypothetical protein